jgi:broad specificity phosphatase PhoE
LKKRLLLIRHGQSQANCEGRVQGWLDSPLSELGHLQSESLSRRLTAEYQVDRIFSSPLSRASETAVHLGCSLQTSITYNDDLKERGLGTLTGLTKSEIESQFPEVDWAWKNNLPRPPIHGIEMDEAFHNRVDRALAAVLTQTEVEMTVAVVSHGGTLNKILQLCLALPQSGPSTFSFKNTSLTVIEIYENFSRLILLNDTCHLNHLGALDAERTSTFSESHYPG